MTGEIASPIWVVFFQRSKPVLIASQFPYKTNLGVAEGNWSTQKLVTTLRRHVSRTGFFLVYNTSW